MKDEKLLNLSEMSNEHFEIVKEAVEGWKSAGYSGKFGFVTEQEVQESFEALKKAFQKTYNKGIWRGGFALAGGFLLGSLICNFVEHLTDKHK